MRAALVVEAIFLKATGRPLTRIVLMTTLWLTALATLAQIGTINILLDVEDMTHWYLMHKMLAAHVVVVYLMTIKTERAVSIMIALVTLLEILVQVGMMLIQPLAEDGTLKLLFQPKNVVYVGVELLKRMMSFQIMKTV